MLTFFHGKTVKNLLTVLSSRVGGLGSTRPAATEDEITDKRAEKARSDEGVYDVDQHLVNDWGRASDGGNDGKGGYTRCLEGGKRSAQCRGGNKWTV